MCNAWNHPPGCRCGWGGDGHLGRSSGGWGGNGHLGPSSGGFGAYDVRTPAGRTRAYTDSFVNPNAHCPVCGAPVFFYKSPHGGRVYFDELGWPWPKHPCTDNRQHSRPLTGGDTQTLDRLLLRLRHYNLPTQARHVPPAPAPKILPSAPRPSTTPAPPPRPTPRSTTEEAAALVVQARREARTDEARTLLAAAISLDPEAIDAWLALADTLSSREERAYCLRKALGAAIRGRFHSQERAIHKQLGRLSDVQPKPPAALTPAAQRAAPPSPRLPAAPPPTTPPVSATPAATQRTASAAASRASWLLVVRVAQDGQPVRWLLCDGARCYEGATPRTPSEQTTALTALLEGLRALSQRQSRPASELRVVSNARPAIALAKGTLAAQSKADRRMLRTIATMRAGIATVSFQAMRVEALDELIAGLPR